MIERFIKSKQLVKDVTMKNLAKPYLEKAHSNLITMEILSNVEKHKALLAIPEEHTTDEWVVVAAYYAMYMAALSLIAKLGYKSESHAATSIALEEFFVNSQLLGEKHLANFENICMRKEEIETLRDVKERRKTAQYSVTKRTTKELAENTKSDARDFVDRIEEIFDRF